MANLRIVSTIGPNPLDEVQELFELYVKASPETRELLLKSSRRYVLDSASSLQKTNHCIG